jgi:hypothetical protein
VFRGFPKKEAGKKKYDKLGLINSDVSFVNDQSKL